MHDSLSLAVFVPSGQGLKQMGELALAFGLSALIGIEREWRQKAAGLRTYTLVGAGAALFMLVSKYGFGDVIGKGVTLDPSRVAAQILSGIGFIGAGLIFIRGAAVRGLTTAAGVWMTVAVGTASGAGPAILALAGTAGYLVVVLGFPVLEERLPRGNQVLGLPAVAVTLEVSGQPSADDLTEALERVDGVLEVSAGDSAA